MKTNFQLKQQKLECDDDSQVSVELCDGELTEKETEKSLVRARASMYTGGILFHNLIKKYTEIFVSKKKTTDKILSPQIIVTEIKQTESFATSKMHREIKCN